MTKVLKSQLIISYNINDAQDNLCSFLKDISPENFVQLSQSEFYTESDDIWAISYTVIYKEEQKDG